MILSYLGSSYYAGLSRRIKGLTRALLSKGITPIIISPIFRLDKPLFYKGKVIHIDLRRIRKFSIHNKVITLIATILFSTISLVHITRLHKHLKIMRFESKYSFIPALIAKILFNVKIIRDEVNSFLIKKSFR